MPPKFALKKLVQQEPDKGPINYTETGSVKLLQETRGGTESTVKISNKKGLIGDQIIDLSRFTLIKRIGQESLNEGVDIVQDTLSKQKLVLKKIKIDPKKVKEILSEVNLLASCKNQHIVTLHNAIQESGKITLILEFMDCGALNDIVEFLESVGTKLTETAISQISESILLGLQYLHEQRNTVHRDLKPANILVNSIGQVKIADFGSAGIDSVSQHLQTFVGSEAYMSPERLKGEKYSTTSDIWSLGIITAYCLFGKFPFSLDDTKSTTGINLFGLLKVVQNKDFMDLTKTSASPELIDFVNQCCTVDNSKRPEAGELLKHEFIVKHRDTSPSFKEYVRENYVKKRQQIREAQKK
jgi:serine/threonine protein kinase